MTKLEHLVTAISNWLAHHGLPALIIVVITAIALKVAAVLNRKLLVRLFRNRQDTDSQKVARALTSALHWLVCSAILVVGLFSLLGESGVNLDWVFSLALTWLLTRGLGIIILVVLTFVALKIGGILSDRLVTFLNRDKLDIESQKRADTLSSVMRWVLRTSILLVASVMLLSALGVQIGPIIAAAGVVGLAVGFGAQNLVQDVISGFFLLLEDQIRVGDVVQVNDKSGLVEKVTLRMTILRDFAGSVHYLRNGKIDVVTNMTKEFSFSVFEIGVAYREDPDEIAAVVQAIGKEIQNDPRFKDDILAPVEVVGLDKFADSAIIIKARIKTKPSKQWGVGREFNRRLKKKFDELGIEIPFPSIALYPGKDKKTDSPSFKVELQRNEVSGKNNP
jgi:moderate conductance mechanosensitive channel